MNGFLTGLTPLEIVILLLSMLLSLSLHEAMHGFMAHWLGDDTAADMGRLTLNPLQHVDLYTTILLPLGLILLGLPPFFAAKPVPFDPSRVRFSEFGAALVGLAGPATNLVLAIIGGILFRVISPEFGSLTYNGLQIFTAVNIGFFVFNMIPFPPLDGSRLLYAVAPEPVQELMYRIEQMGFIAIILFVMVLFQFIAGPVVAIEQGLLNLLLG